MRILTFSTLYPNTMEPLKGLFVERRVRHVADAADVELRVVAPIPHFPFRSRFLPRYSNYRDVPLEARRDGVGVLHPRYVAIPKVGMSLAPWLLSAGSMPLIAQHWAGAAAPDVIDAHFFYPDGVAAAMIARRLGRPLVITARGSDINLYTRFALQRRMIRWAGQTARYCIAVSEDLRRRMVAIGIPADRIEVIPNGVDLERFAPRERSACRRQLGLDGRVALMVGNLVKLKGHALAVDALSLLAGWTLVVVGEGPEERALRAHAARAGLAARVKFVGRVSPEDLPTYYSAADVLLMPSESEGFPNVLLEALACGLRVVATRVGGIPEIVDTIEAGELIEERSAAAIAAGVIRLVATPADIGATTRCAARFSWRDSARRHLDVLRAAARAARSNHR